MVGFKACEQQCTCLNTPISYLPLYSSFGFQPFGSNLINLKTMSKRQNSYAKSKVELKRRKGGKPFLK